MAAADSARARPCPRGRASHGVLLAVLLSASTAQAQLPEPVALALTQAGIPDTHLGLLVTEIGNPAPLLAHGEARSLNPASVMKLVTTLAALELLGPAHTFRTRVEVEGEIRDGVLFGNLILRGGGDPALTRERFWSLLREVRARGIREIRGDLILDDRFYALPAIDPAAFDQAPLRPYNAPPAALLANFNSIGLRLAPDGGAVRAALEVEQALPLDNRLVLSEAPCNGLREQLDLRVEEGVLRLAGRYPVACAEQVIALNLLAPPATAAVWFRALWQELGGRHAGGVRVCAAGDEARLLLEHESPPLALLVRDINKHSNNVMAKMLFLNLGAARFGAPATWDKGARAVREWLTENGLWSEEMVFDNGSGLSRIERISAASMNRLLQYAAARPAYYEFAASLPATGLEGTRKNPPNASPLAGQSWLKTGSLNGVRGLAGYVLGADGRRRVLTLLINHRNAQAAGPVQDALLAWTAGLGGDVTATPPATAGSEFKH